MQAIEEEQMPDAMIFVPSCLCGKALFSPVDNRNGEELFLRANWGQANCSKSDQTPIRQQMMCAAMRLDGLVTTVGNNMRSHAGAALIAELRQSAILCGG